MSKPQTCIVKYGPERLSEEDPSGQGQTSHRRRLAASGQARRPAASSSAAGSAAWLGGISRRRRSPGAAMRPAGRRAARSHGRAGRARRQGGRGAVCVHRSADNSPWWRLLLLPKLVPLVRLLLSRPHAP